MEDAICLHAFYYAIWKRYGALPERYNWQLQAPDVPFYPLRPELVESTYLLYQVLDVSQLTARVVARMGLFSQSHFYPRLLGCLCICLLLQGCLCIRQTKMRLNNLFKTDLAGFYKVEACAFVIEIAAANVVAFPRYIV